MANSKSESGSKSGLFLVLALVMTLVFMISSLPAPILPREALSRNASVTQYSVVISMFDLTRLVASPGIGAWAQRMGTVASLNVGVALCGISTILFGTLGYTAAGAQLFIGIECVMRIIEGIGNCFVYMTINFVIARLFPKNVAFAVGVMESVLGFANSIGPFAGSALFQLGGFPLPFEAIGGVTLALGVVVFFLLRSWKHLFKKETAEIIDVSKQDSIFAIFKFPPIPVYFWIIVLGAINTSFLQCLLAVQLQKFQLSQIYIGLVFLMNAGVYAIFSPGLCHLCTKTRVPEVFPIAGFLGMMTGYLLIGPAPFLPIDQTLGLLLGSVCLISIGNAAILSPCYVIALKELDASYSSDTANNSMRIASYFSSCIALGFFVGPLLAGSSYDAYTFPYAILLPFGLDALQVVFLVIFTIWKHTCYNQQRISESEVSPLLRAQR